MTAKLIADNIIISDATVLINFLSTGEFSLLLEIYEGRLHVTDMVRAEIRFNRSELDVAIGNGQVIEHKISVEQTAHLVKHFDNFDAGEASCFILAKENSWRIATDDRAAIRFIKRDLGPLYTVTTFGVLLEGVQLGKLKKDRATSIIAEMESKARFLIDLDEYKKFIDQLKLY